MTERFPDFNSRRVGILVLNYHEPDVTLACIKRLLEVESLDTCILWLENDAGQTMSNVLPLLQASSLPWVQIDPATDPLPPIGHMGFVPILQNLGYAGGNNIGLKFLHRHNIEFAWVLNNDTLHTKGSSIDLIRAAESDPNVGLWGTRITASHTPMYYGGILSLKDFSIRFATNPDDLDRTHLCFISGCSMFFRTALAAELNWIPEDYFLYYEDPSFSLEVRGKNLRLGFCPQVEVLHLESLSTGRRSYLMEFYNRRNRWFFIQRYFPDQLSKQISQRWYIYQKLLFRAKWRRIRLECTALEDFKAGRLGPTHRDFSRFQKI